MEAGVVDHSTREKWALVCHTEHQYTEHQYAEHQYTEHQYTEHQYTEHLYTEHQSWVTS